MIFINFKAYEKGSGHRATDLIRIIQEVSMDSDIKIIPVVQIIDAESIVDLTTLNVWMQHIDPISYGAHTGWTLPEEAARIGIKGVFLNHSEHKFEDFGALVKANARCLEVNLKTLIFAEDINELEKIIKLKPNYVSYEPPELVGETEISVATAKPETIKQASEITSEANIPLIVGAGIHSKSDVEKSLELGADGIAVATKVVKAEDPEKELRELLSGFEK